MRLYIKFLIIQTYNFIIKDMDINNLQKYENSLHDSREFKTPSISDTDIISVCEYFPKELYSFNSLRTKLKDIENIIFSFIDYYKLNKICVSLSGGVDSMVSLSILKFLNDSNKIDIELCAFHLNYNNREESVIEMEMIKRYCNNIMIPLYTYSIEHIHRYDKDITRKQYEKLTRQIRFECYKYINMPIALGHIEDDIVENIITNLATNKHTFQLGKFQDYIKQEGVILVRPLLNIPKSAIYEYSEKHGIPHLKNTTPEWSNRGKFRNRFYNEFIEQYGDNAILNIKRVAIKLEKYGKLIEKIFIKPYVEELKDNSTLTFNDDILDNDDLLQTILSKYFHSINESKPSLKSVKELINKINSLKNTYKYPFIKRKMKYMIKKGYTIEINREFLEIKKS